MPVGPTHSSVQYSLDSVMASSARLISASTAAISSATPQATYSANHTLAATRRQTSLDIKEQRERSMDLAATSYTGDTETREKPKIPKPHDVRSPRATAAPVTGVSGRIADLTFDQLKSDLLRVFAPAAAAIKAKQPLRLVRVSDGRSWPSAEFPKHLRMREVFRDGDALTCLWGKGATVMDKNGKPRFQSGSATTFLPRTTRKHKPKTDKSQLTQPLSGKLEPGSTVAMRGALLASFPTLKSRVRYSDGSKPQATNATPASSKKGSVPELALVPNARASARGSSRKSDGSGTPQGLTARGKHLAEVARGAQEEVARSGVPDDEGIAMWSGAAVFQQGRLVGSTSHANADIV